MRRRKAPPVPIGDDGDADAPQMSWTLASWASMEEAYGPIVRIVESKLRDHDFANDQEGRDVPPYFVELFRPLWLWPADFLRIVGLDAWEFPPFCEAVRLLHVAARLPRERSIPSIESLEVFGEFVTHQLMTPLFGDAGQDDDALQPIGDEARNEVQRWLDVERGIVSRRRRRSMRDFAVYIQHARLMRGGQTWKQAAATLAGRYHSTPDGISRSAQSGRRRLGLRRPRRPLPKAPTTAPDYGTCPDHGKPLDGMMTCADCLSEAEPH